MSELQDVVAALRTEVSVLEVWAKDQHAALVMAKEDADAVRAQLEADSVALESAHAEIADLTAKLAAATPGTAATAAIVADLHSVLDHISAIAPPVAVPEVVVPEKPEPVPVEVTSGDIATDTSVHNESAIAHDLAAPVTETVDKPASTPVVDTPLVVEAPVVETPSAPTEPVEVDAGHNGET